MAVKGISLKLDEHGEVAAIEQPDGELCSGVVICPNCKDNICDVKGVHWGELRECPFKKWFILAPCKKTEANPLIGYPEDRCFVCGGKNFWRKKDGSLICQACHPSALPEGQIERMDITGNKIKPNWDEKPKKVKRSVSVRKTPRKKIKQEQFFT
jgi:hypothetical protein